MSIETRVLVNGQWVTRIFDHSQILAGNREDNKLEAPSVASNISMPPTCGILTRTLVRSPVINLIIPAQIRHKDKNDVVFVREDSLEIYELSADGVLQHVTTKADFDSSIRAAKAMGDASKPGIPQMISHNDEPVKVKDEKQETGDIFASGRSPLPPQILVLVLESMQLVFLYVTLETQNRLNYKTYQQPLPTRTSYNERVGRHLSIDPKSRAIAVAACEGSLSVYSLKSMDYINEEVESTNSEGSFVPILGERHFVVEGIIHKIEFLYPPRGDDTLVVLLLIVYRKGKPRFVLYEWDCTKDLTCIRESAGSGQRVVVPPEGQLPSLLIPFTIDSAFMIMYEKGFAVYKNILTGHAEHAFQKLSHQNDEPPEEPGNSKRLPLFTQWARPLRRPAMSLNQDDIYLSREDGVVRFLEIKKTDKMVDSSHKAGKLKIPIGTAFATLSRGLHHNDLLVVGGDQGNGGLWEFGPRQAPIHLQALSNWSPVLDLTAVEMHSSMAGHTGLEGLTLKPPKCHERIVACTGRGKEQGAVTDMRYGIAATTSALIDLNTLKEVTDGAILQIWALSSPISNSLFLLISHPQQTSLIRVDPEGQSDSEMVDEDDVKIDFGARTIAATSTRDGMVIQVTEQSMRAIAIRSPHRPFIESHQASKCLAACVLQNGVLSALKVGNDFQLHLGDFKYDDQKIDYRRISGQALIPAEPSCLSLQLIHDEIFAFVATVDGMIGMFYADTRSGLTLISTYSFDDSFAICVSMAMLCVDGHEDNPGAHVLICGLRNGTIQTFRVNRGTQPKDTTLDLCESISVGNTSVMVRTDETKSSRALFTCDQHFCTLEYSPHLLSKGPATVNNIWLSMSSKQDYQQQSITSFTQVDSWSPVGGLLMSVEDSQLYMSRLVLKTEPDILPRHLPTAGSPTRVIYSKRLHKLIVSYIIIRTTQNIQNDIDAKGTRALQPMIKFLDLDSRPSDMDVNNLTLDSVSVEIGSPGGKILGLTEWFPSGYHGSYYMLIINTIIEASSGTPASGQMLFYRFGKPNTDGSVRPELRMPVTCHDPVYSVVPYGQRSLIYCSGLDLAHQTLDIGPAVNRWLEPKKFRLRSPATHISVHDDYIYTTTARGLTIFKFNDETGFSEHSSDSIAREGLHHLNLPEHSLVLTSNSSCGVTGLWQPPGPRIDNSASTVFESQLPGSIIRFSRAFTAQPWYRYTNGQDPRTILGTTIAGSIHQFTILSESQWRLLRFIQNMAMRHPLICHFTYQRTHRKHIEPETGVPRYMHVDGDVILRTIDNGGARLLGEMLDREPVPEERFADFDTQEERRERFREVVAEAGWDDGGEMGELLERVVANVARLLVPGI